MAKGVKNLNEYVYKEGHSGAPHVRALRKLIKMGHYDRYVEQVKRVLMQLVRPLAKSEGLVLGKKGSASHSLDVYISS